MHMEHTLNVFFNAVNRILAGHTALFSLIFVFLAIGIICLEKVLQKKGEAGQKKSRLLSSIILGILGVIIVPLLINAAAYRNDYGYYAALEEIYQDAVDCMAEDDYADARYKLEDLLKSDPYNARYHACLGDVYSKMESYGDALREYNEAIQLNPKYGEYHRKLGMALFYSGDCPGAIEEMELAVELQPNNYKNHEWLGFLQVKEGQYDEAETAYLASIALDGSHPELYEKLAKLYDLQGNYNLALEKIDAAIAAGGDEEYYTRIQKLIQQEQVVQENPDDDFAHNKLGVIYYDRRDYENALTEFQAAISLAPEVALYRHNRGHTYYHLKDYSAAKEDLTAAIAMADETDRENWKLLYNLVITEEATKSAPEDANALLNYGYALYRLGNYHGAITQFESARELPLGDNTKFGLDMAIEQLKKHESQDLDADQAQLHYGLGYLFYFVRNDDAMLWEARAAVDCRPESASNHNLLACALESVGDYQGALAEYQEAARLAPDFSVYQENLRSIQDRLSG